MPGPSQAKKLGREVRGFDDARWTAHRFDIAVRGNVAKFGQNPPLGQWLRSTAEAVLVEASPVDRIWGIGLAADDPRARDPLTWLGLNLLGFALMKARAALG
ncbi:NADAR family protein [Bradyrhizobium sp. HKCCYLR20261]|uniref:NADAR family protein n=1 Tax=Bradyrhizobium sp. HKCCYLR20261 TaxID=3420760 RepID=UPI003EBFA2CD